MPKAPQPMKGLPDLRPATLHAAVEHAADVDQLAEIEREARAIGYSPDGILLRKLTAKRDELRGAT